MKEVRKILDVSVYIYIYVGVTVLEHVSFIDFDAVNRIQKSITTTPTGILVGPLPLNRRWETSANARVIRVVFLFLRFPGSVILSRGKAAFLLQMLD